MTDLSLGEFVEITSSKRIKRADYVPDGIPFYRSKEVIERAKGNKISTELFISEEQFSEIEKKFGAPKPGDILLTSVGTLGVSWRVQEDTQFYFKDGNLTWFRNFDSKLDSKYLMYWLRSRVGQQELDRISIGSTQRALTIVALKSLPFSPPPVSDQKAIAHILGTLDDKIELNQKMNQTLEEIAKAIFKSWFVDFDPVRAKAEGRPTGLPPEISDLFPDELVDSEIGEIPKGWSATPLSDAINLDSGFAYKGKSKGRGDKFLVTMGCVSQSNRFSAKGLHRYEGEFKDRNIVKAGDICVSSHDVTQAREHLGAPFIVPESIGNTITAAATNTFIVRPAGRLSTEFLYQLFQTQRYRNEMIASAKGTAILHISKTAVTNFLYCDPTKALKDNFDSLAIPIAQRINVLTDENQALADLRDTLLPKLMSGELRIPDAEKFLEEAGI